MKLDEFIEKISQKALLEGFSDYELYYIEGESFGVGAYEGKIDRYEVNNNRGISFRGIIEGKMGMSYSEALDEAATEELVLSAKENASLTDRANDEFFHDGSGEYQDVVGYFPALEALGDKEKIEMALTLEEKTLQKDKRIKSVEHCLISTGSAKVRIVNSKGLDKSFCSNLASAVVVPVAEQDGRMYSGFSEQAFCDFSELDLDEMADEATLDALSYVGSKPIKSGQYPIVLKRSVMSELLGCFAGVFNAENAQKGYSRLYQMEGQKIASECVTLIDDPNYPEGLANTPFDGEGFPTYKKAVVSNGLLETLLHNLKTAAKDKKRSTGNASRGSYKSAVGICPHQFYLVPSKTPLEKLFEAGDGGIFVTEISGLHAGANMITGDFSLSAKGFRIENNKKGEPLEQFIVSGNFYDLLKEISLVADDLKFESPSAGGCFGSPSVFVPFLTVAGS